MRSSPVAEAAGVGNVGLLGAQRGTWPVEPLEGKLKKKNPSAVWFFLEVFFFGELLTFLFQKSNKDHWSCDMGLMPNMQLCKSFVILPQALIRFSKRLRNLDMAFIAWAKSPLDNLLLQLAGGYKTTSQRGSSHFTLKLPWTSMKYEVFVLQSELCIPAFTPPCLSFFHFQLPWSTLGQWQMFGMGWFVRSNPNQPEIPEFC